MNELFTAIGNSCTTNHDKSLGYWKQNMFLELKLNFSSTAVLLIACVWTTFFRLNGKTEFFSSPQQRFIITLTVFRFFNPWESFRLQKGKVYDPESIFKFPLLNEFVSFPTSNENYQTVQLQIHFSIQVQLTLLINGSCCCVERP